MLFAFLAAVELFVVAAFAILLLGPSPFPPLPGLARDRSRSPTSGSR